jgi:hypothetical protein
MIVLLVITLNLGHAISRLEEPHDPGAIPCIAGAADVVHHLAFLGRGTAGATIDAQTQGQVHFYTQLTSPGCQRQLTRQPPR